MKKTAAWIQGRKAAGEPIAMLTCYDYPTARWQELAGVDILLVGDSVGTNILGYEDETQVTLADIAHHVGAVSRGAESAYVIGDLPYGTCDSPEAALEHASALIEAGADGVKLEGHKPEVVGHLSTNGIEVCAHLGLNPQIHDAMRMQAKTADGAMKLLQESLSLQAAGAWLIVYELIPEAVGAAATRHLRIPTIGIGAGRYTDGQVLVVPDVLGMHDKSFRHSKTYANFAAQARAAFEAYVRDVKGGAFPTEENAGALAPDELAAFEARLEASAAG